MVDLVKNGSFEVRGQEHVWKLPEGWHISRGFGRNGGGGLVFETAEPLKKTVWAEQTFDVESGRVYDLDAYVEGQLDSPNGIYVMAHFLDAEGRKVGFARTISHGANRKWGKVSARTKRLPENAKRVRVCLVVPQGAKGKVFFDHTIFIHFFDGN